MSQGIFVNVQRKKEKKLETFLRLTLELLSSRYIALLNFPLQHYS